MIAAAPPLFYAADMVQQEVQLLMHGVSAVPVFDTIDFPQEGGGTQDRLLAIPYLPGMDTVKINEAAFAFRVGDMSTDIFTFSASNEPSSQGTVLRLAQSAKLRKVEIEYEAPEPIDGVSFRVIVRPVDGTNFGPPIFAAPHFPAPGPTFGPVLAGMSIDTLSGNRRRLSFADMLGSAWLIQIAKGNSVTELEPLEIRPQIKRVTIAATPNDLSVTLAGDPPTSLWSNPGVLLPESGLQEVSFLPLAQQRMSKALETASPDDLTLPLSINFDAASAARLEVTQRALSGIYEVRPLLEDSKVLRLGGRADAIEMEAPEGLRPTAGKVTLVAKLRGQALNGNSYEAPLSLEGQGLSVNAERFVAAQIQIAQRPDAAIGASVPLSSIAGMFEATEQAELVLELREDAAGRPGAPIGPTIVHQLAKGEKGWVDFNLPAPITVAPDTVLWATIRMTKGEVFWHAGNDASVGAMGFATVSVDSGASWGDASIALEQPLPLLVQAFHLVDPPQPRPEIRLSVSGVLLPTDWFAEAVVETPTQYRVETTFPGQVLDAFAMATALPGEARAKSKILLHSASVLDLVLSEVSLEYDPTVVRAR